MLVLLPRPKAGSPNEQQPPNLCVPKGATVLFVNATDLDRSREYGQESIIYSLEGSSQFRINARSGEPPRPWSCAPPLTAGPAREPAFGQESPSSCLQAAGFFLSVIPEIFI